jgi:ATPase subunit of ABC transporter with duplicated ATPase domains
LRNCGNARKPEEKYEHPARTPASAEAEGGGGIMLQIKNLTITLRKDLRAVVENFTLTLNAGDKAVIIGEEGDGKSTLLNAVGDAEALAAYADVDGEVLTNGARIGFIKQDLTGGGELSVGAYCAAADGFWDLSPPELSEIARELCLDAELFFSERAMSALSGGERVKLRLARLLIEKPDIYLLDEPSNDIDVETLKWLERFILESRVPVLFVSHDETLIERTANVIIHIELTRRKACPRVTVSRLNYRDYAARREAAVSRQARLARNEKSEYDAKMERFRQIQQRVEHEQAAMTRQNPHGGQLLKKKMRAVKSMERRFERESADMTRPPDVEDAVFLKFDERISLPGGKTVLDFTLNTLENGGKVLARGIRLTVRGAEKICIVGKNGAGKTSLLRLIAAELLEREDIRAAYMPQNYADILDLSKTPGEFLAPSGKKEDVTRALTYLGSVRYTPDEMRRAIGELSGGQRGKLLLVKMILDGAGVLILDEPTRNLSPVSGPVLRGVLRNFGGAVISVSHDRKYIAEVCPVVYELTETGLVRTDRFGAF